MKIIEMVSCTGTNGAINHCLLLSRQLARRGHDVTVVCLSGSWISRQLAGEPIDVVESDLHRFPADELGRIAAVARAKGIDVVHTHCSRAHFFGVLLRWFAGVPVVATAHHRLLQLHWMFNDRVIAVSEATRRFQRRVNRVPGSRLATIHNFVEDRPAGPPRHAPGEIRAALGFDEDALVVGLVGNATKRKAQLYAVRALPRILAACPRTHLLLIGELTDRRYLARVQATAERLGVAGHVTWLGHRNDVREILCALDLFILPSLEESFPLAILEAMAAGLPVVATAVGGVAECVVSGSSGLLVPPRDSDALAGAMLSLLMDPARRRQFGQAGREHVQSRFSAESQVPAIEAVLGEAAAARRAARPAA